jgi:hypothetical protein
MNSILPYLISPAATLLIAVAGYALFSRSRDAAKVVSAENEGEAKRIRSALAAEDLHSRELFRAELAAWQVQFLRDLNGTYLRGELAKLLFKTMEDKLAALDVKLDGLDGYLKRHLPGAVYSVQTT